MTEKEMREAEVPKINTSKELIRYINKLVKQKHDYGTRVYAMSMSAQAAFNFVAHKLRVSGFQASCADLDFLKRTRGMENGFKILDFNNILYPQYCNSELFPNWYELLLENADHISEVAKQKLKTEKHAHKKVIAHWKFLSRIKEYNNKIIEENLNKHVPSSDAKKR